MKVVDLYKNEDVHFWLGYNPKESQYLRFSPNVVAAGFKIVDVYYSFCYARQSLLFIESNDYGELVEPHNDEIGLLSMRSYFLLNALAFYNYCIDLSWQVAWFYYGDCNYNVIQDSSKFAKASTKCTFDELNYILTLSQDLKLRKNYRDFFNNELTAMLREKYNYIKHRGTLHFDGLGKQYEYLGIKVADKRPRMLVKEVVEVDVLKEDLIKFDISFKRYFDCLIKGIMPIDYLNNTFSMEHIYEFHKKM